MTISAGSSIAAVTSAASTTTLQQTGITASAGMFAVMCVASDNIGTTDGDLLDVLSVADSVGNAWYKALQFTNGQAGAGAGATASIWWANLTTALASGSITATFASAITHKAMGGMTFSKAAAARIIRHSTTDTFAVDGGNVSTRSISGLTSREYLFVRCDAAEGITTNGAASTAPDWTQLASGNSGASGMNLFAEYTILTATASGNSNPSNLTGTTDRASALCAFYETTTPRSMVLPIGRTF